MANVPSKSEGLRFEIHRNRSLVRTEEFSEATIKIGRLPSSHLRLDDTSVARIHAVIERSSAGEAHLIDLGSSRGTWVGGQRVSKHLLREGDEVMVGETTLKVSFVAAEPIAAEQPQGWYDEAGNWHDGVGGYYDPSGAYHSPHGGWLDEGGNYFDGLAIEDCVQRSFAEWARVCG